MARKRTPLINIIPGNCSSFYYQNTLLLYKLYETSCYLKETKIGQSVYWYKFWKQLTHGLCPYSALKNPLLLTPNKKSDCLAFVKFP